MNLAIRVKLPQDRTQTGTLVLIDPATGLPLAGPFPVLGRSARNQAKLKDNASADPTKPYGDTPLGSYEIPRIVRNGDGTTRPVNKYGNSGSIVLEPTGGQALTAKSNGRTGLLIHAGRHALSSLVPAAALKPTNGCIRILDWDLQRLLSAIRDNALLFPGVLTVEISTEPGTEADLDNTIDDPDPPPTEGARVLP